MTFYYVKQPFLGANLIVMEGIKWPFLDLEYISSDVLRSTKALNGHFLILHIFECAKVNFPAPKSTWYFFKFTGTLKKKKEIQRLS